MKTKLLLPLLLILFACTSKPPNVNNNQSEIDYRLTLISDRINFGKTPEITDDFILAGVTLDKKFSRRFTNYSGDQAGRYLSAMSYLDVEDNPIDIHKLVNEIIATQKPDGRFGADSLSFKAAEIEGPQMALLWGNGRLLAGLLDYYIRYPEHKEALKSAEKLGGFVDQVTYDCTRPEIIERFKTMGAMGFICFTQLTEGMAKLYIITGKEKYREIAESTYPLLPECGNQHSHGYLNTLRGVAMLYEATKDPAQLNYVEEAYYAFVNSPEYMITGGLPEFFGRYKSNDDYRDEGCSEADFLILSIQLWQLTGKMEYLDQAEYTLLNHMFYNQFGTGDFGHHHIKQNFGFVASDNIGRSWWCCNYHGINALSESKDIVITETNNTIRINMFFNSSFKRSDVEIKLIEKDPYSFSYELIVNNLTANDIDIAIRKPGWADKISIKVSDAEVSTEEKDGYMHLQSRKKEEVFSIQINPKLRLVDKKHNLIDLRTIEPIFEGAIIYGPYLLGADNGFSPLFLSEPSEHNQVYVNENLLQNPLKAHKSKIPENSFVKRGYLQFQYRHDALYEISEVVLRPISECSYEENANVRYWFRLKLDSNQ